ncbi:MAG: hypothetical protein FD143_2680 [Ignavibacteria bacterium]|nr:MAG: hypothetical protein FD143_2680 [Ignavibacteria bacterium]KAF0156808.1 MAG: hypothetical protein FD188_2872 [Ignavibacteria bacterium]
MRNKSVALIVVILFASLSYAQNKISLLDTEKVNEYLELTQEQTKIINPKIEQIKKILEDDRRIISAIKERVKNNDEPGFFEKIGVKRGHDKRASKVEDLIDEIKDQLNDQQIQKFKNIEKPELKPLKKEEIFGK